ncbi:outer membrane beta-barrel protein [Silvimonas amylolytica]|uniref:Beta-barrel porin 2 n=1 Tax=Silvimonas amylolytica TaxID=449663 RepID=A0ABQ2PQJ2_9NEIS|nr:outer membrane beta-barrel protein [Silvimonas amylolytica]GGP27890.1 hypothetical protein GCM10010971_37090 [Silvimonas amylolytica]
MKTRLKLLPLGSVLASAMCAAAYDPSDSISTYAQLGYMYDSNVFRLSDSQDPEQALGKDHRGDSIITPQVGGHIAADVSRQQFTLDANVYAPRYMSFSDLNYVGWNNSVGWNGEIGHSWFGSASFGDQKVVSDFGDVLLNQEDLMRTLTGSAEGGYRINSSVSLIVDASRARVRHSQETTLDLYNTQYAGKVQYTTDRGGVFSLGERYQTVDYENQTFNGFTVNQDYTQRITQLTAYYPFDPRFDIAGGYGYVKIHTDTTDQSDWQANATLNWHTTDRTKLSFGYSHALNAPGSTYGESIKSHYQLGGEWKVTDKIVTNASLAYDKYDYPASLNVAAYNDNVKTAYIGASWKPRPSIDTTFYASWANRDSNVEIRTYDDWQLGATVQILF